MAQPLSGLLVLDFTTLLPGPLATLMLAEAGAEVIKIERPGGEEVRAHAPRWDSGSASYALLNRGKKSITVDLKKPLERNRLMTLLRRADVLVEQFRPGVMARLGVGYDAVRAINPRVVYCSISGYGQKGPRAQDAGHDLNYIATTGLLALNPGSLSHPVVPPALVADIAGGSMPAVLNILLGLRERELTGHGCYLDIAMADAMFTFAWHGLAVGFATGRFPNSGQAALAGGSPRYQLYPTKDGKLVACAALEQKFWLTFVNAIGLAPALADDQADPDATKRAVADLIMAKTADEWRPIFAAADCCVTLVASLEEAVRDRHFIERGLFAHQLSGQAKTQIPALPVPIAPAFRDPPGTAKTVARLGANNNLLENN